MTTPKCPNGIHSTTVRVVKYKGCFCPRCGERVQTWQAYLKSKLEYERRMR